MTLLMEIRKLVNDGEVEGRQTETAIEQGQQQSDRLIIKVCCCAIEQPMKTFIEGTKQNDSKSSALHFVHRSTTPLFNHEFTD